MEMRRYGIWLVKTGFGAPAATVTGARYVISRFEALILMGCAAEQCWTLVQLRQDWFGRK
jgi:hypothetical protein